jgi:hypothetical protein
MTNSEKLRALADWFDQYDAKQKNDFDKISNQVQTDLRAMATEFEQLQQHGVVRESPPVKEEIDLYLKGQRDTIKLIFDYILGLDEPLVGGGQAQNVSDGLPKRKSFKERLAEEMEKAKIGQPKGG